MMTCLTWRTLQSKVFVLHFNQHFNMPWSERRKTANENWSILFNQKAKKWWRREIYLLIVTQWPEWHMDVFRLSSNKWWLPQHTTTSKAMLLCLLSSMLKCWLEFVDRMSLSSSFVGVPAGDIVYSTCMTITVSSAQWLHLKKGADCPFCIRY